MDSTWSRRRYRGRERHYAYAGGWPLTEEEGSNVAFQKVIRGPALTLKRKSLCGVRIYKDITGALSLAMLLDFGIWGRILSDMLCVF